MAETLIGCKTMRRWGLILDCKTEEVVLNQRKLQFCLQLEDETSPSNMANLTETMLTSDECMPTVGDHSSSIAPGKEDKSVKRKTPLPSVKGGSTQRNQTTRNRLVPDHHLDEVVLSVQGNDDM